MTDFIITALVTAVSLLIIAQLPFGISIDSLGKALIAGFVIGLLNALVKPILFILTLPVTVLTLGLFLFVLNGIIFALATKIVSGFRLNGGFMSAIFGVIALSLINSFLFLILERVFGIAA
jgi:putative membrane protein